MNEKTKRLAGKRYMAKQIKRSRLSIEEKRTKRSILRSRTGCQSRTMIALFELTK